MTSGASGTSGGAGRWPVEPNEFRWQTGLRGVVAGLGSVEEKLAPTLKAQGVARPMIVCGTNLAVSPVLKTVVRSAGVETVVFDGSRPHTPVETVDAGAAAARQQGVNGLISVGGSSAVDCAKGIAVLLSTGHQHVDDLAPSGFGRLSEPFDPAGQPPVPLVMVSTTLSFAEFLPFWGVRRADQGRKTGYPDYGRVLRTAFLDGLMAAHTPDGVWFETGIKALDDAIAGFCRGPDPEPFLDPVLIEGIAGLVAWLGASGGHEPGGHEPGGHEPADRRRAEARQRVLTACWLTKQPLPRLDPTAYTGWFSTAARHALGGVLGLPHGAGSCVALPEALRFHAARTRDRQAALAGALGWQGGDDEAPLEPGVTSLLAELGVPTSLAPWKVDDADLDHVAEHMLAESPALGSPALVRRALARLR